MAKLDGEPIVRRVVEAALASRADPVIVVVGHARGAVEAAVADLPAIIAFNSAFETGIASSLRTGLAATPPDADGAVVLLGDMPNVAPSLIDGLIGAFRARRPARSRAFPRGAARKSGSPGPKPVRAGDASRRRRGRAATAGGAGQTQYRRDLRAASGRHIRHRHAGRSGGGEREARRPGLEPDCDPIIGAPLRTSFAQAQPSRSHVRIGTTPGPARRDAA